MAMVDTFTFKNKTFDHQGVSIDGTRFVNCKFIRCKVIFKGTELPVFENCVFEECEWTFDSAAENTLQFLADLYTGLGAEGKQLVESVFLKVRSGTVSDSVIPLVPLNSVRG